MAAPSNNGPVVIESNAPLSAVVVKDKGNTNTLTVSVNNASEQFTIANNSSGLFEVAGYLVYVATYGNTKISDLYVVSAPTPVCGHDYGMTENYQPATCTTGGYEEYECSLCGDVYGVNTEALGHSYGNGAVTEPTCDNDGFTTYTCEREGCGHSYASDVVAALGHSYGDGVVTEPTCTNDGFTTYTCEREGCEHSYTDAIDALGHVEVIGVTAEILGSKWNGENGSDARFDVTLKLTFTVSRDGDIEKEVIFVNAYFRNNNANNLSGVFALNLGCYDVNVKVNLSATDNNQSASFTVNNVAIDSKSLTCED